MSGAFGFNTKKTTGPTRKGLTATQVIILEAAASSPTQTVMFLQGDRKGTRVVGYDDMGTPRIVAYGTPEFFLEARSLLAKANAPYSYRITDTGRAALSAAPAEAGE